MSDYIKQRPPEKLKYVDEDLLVNKVGRKAFKSAAYSIGIAAGFLIMSPLLPEIGTPEQHELFMGVFRTVAMWMVIYGTAIAVGFFFMRPRVKLIMSTLNWFIMPAVLLWAVFEIKDILSGAA
jgi:hypothetical protein